MPGGAKTLTDAGATRRQHLGAYIRAAIADNVLSWADLTSPDVFEKLLRTIRDDVKYVVPDLARAGGASALRHVATGLMQIANNLGRGDKR